MSGPAWPIPSQNTKLTMAQPQPTGLLLPHRPMPWVTVIQAQSTKTPASAPVTEIAPHHLAVGNDSNGR